MFEYLNIFSIVFIKRNYSQLFSLHSLYIGTCFPQTESPHLWQTVLTLLMLDFAALCLVLPDLVTQILHHLGTLSFSGDGGMSTTGAFSAIFKHTWITFGSLAYEV